MGTEGASWRCRHNHMVENHAHRTSLSCRRSQRISCARPIHTADTIPTLGSVRRCWHRSHSCSCESTFAAATADQHGCTRLFCQLRLTVAHGGNEAWNLLCHVSEAGCCSW